MRSSWKRTPFSTAFSTLLFLVLTATPMNAQGRGDRISGRAHATRSPVIARHGMVATSHPLATQVGLEILKRGGNAIDAAIAANAALGLMEPTGCGIGGDLFAIVWDARTKRLHGLNASGRSPLGLSLERLRELAPEGIPPRGPLPVSVPGAVSGWFALHERFGSLEMRELLSPSIHYAEEGFPLTQLIASYWESNFRVLAEFENFRATFAPGGKIPREGDIFRNADLAKTYRVLAEEGEDAFYRGSLTDVMVRYCERVGCHLRRVDFENHRALWVEPISTSYRGVTVHELPPNGQGLAVLQMLNFLEPLDLRSMGWNSPVYLHALIEAKKLAFEDRARFYADPTVQELPIRGLLSKAYAKKRWEELFDPDRASLEISHGDPKLEEGDTIYLCTADDEGNMVSLIQSNYRGMGSGLLPDGLGFVFQNRGELFTYEEGHPNVYAPGKLPFHTIIPAFATKDGEPWLAFGVMGGAMQPQGHVQVLLNLIDFGMNVQEAGDAARFRHEGSSQPTGEKMRDGGHVVLEHGIDDATADALRALGHRVARTRGGYGGYQAILRDAARGVYFGASESRKDGQAAGF